MVVHPGMSGSALNLSVSQYAEIIRVLQKQGPVLLSQGPASLDQEIVRQLKLDFPEIPVIKGVSLRVLAEVFRLANLVIAPSTGPIHLAHYVGTRTLGLYSPVRSHSPSRWAPWGGSGESETLTPEVDCPGRRDCLGPRCEVYNCMEWTSWAKILSGGS